MIEIQVVGPNSAELLCNVEADVFDHPVRAEWLDEYLATPSNVLVVALHDGTVVGMASGLTYLHPDKPLTLFINEVGVSAKFQGQGVGKRLIAKMLEWGKERGCTEAWVATETSNTAARRLYESTGGIPDEETAIVYVYPLGSWQ